MDVDSKYVDKVLITYAKNPTILRKYFQDRPGELDEALRCVESSLNNTKHVDELVIAELHLEERSKSHDPVDFRCSPKWTVYSAKMKIAEQFPYAKGCLYILYRRQIVQDWMYLRDCGVEQNGDVLYVYIHVPQSIKPRIFANVGTKTTSVNMPQGEALVHDRQLSVKSPIQSLNILPRNFENVKDSNSPSTSNFDLPGGPMEMLEEFNNQDMGVLWACKQCTFMNEGWRTICCMCEAAKPADAATSLPENVGAEAVFQQETIPHTVAAPGNLENAGIKLQSQPQATGGWVCEKCTYENDAANVTCVMCSDRRPMKNRDLLAENMQDANSMKSAGGHIRYSNENMDINVENNPIPAEIQEGESQGAYQRAIIGWRCPGCTYLNEPTRPGCEMCSVQRPEDYEVPEGYQPSDAETARMRKESEAEQEAEAVKSRERKLNYERHISVVDQSIVQSVEPVECMICFTEADPSDTIVLRECLHRFCKDCIVGHIINSEEAVVSCPYADDNYNCDLNIAEREVRALLTEEQFQKYLERGLRQAEKASPNSFHCKTPDCQGWCVYEDQVNTFNCPVCFKNNCLTCKAIHEDIDCKQYQDELQRKAETDEEAKKTKKLLDKMVKDGEAMHCPQCNIIIQKKIGCDWIRCPMCKVEICWVTKGLRWGPKGRGDISGGCHCRENGKKCHKDCNNCH